MFAIPNKTWGKFSPLHILSLGSGRSAALCLARVAQQPVGKGRFPAVEFVQPVVRTERLRCRQTHGLAHTAGREYRSAKPGLSDSGRSSRSSSAWYWLPDTMNSRWSSKVCSAAW